MPSAKETFDNSIQDAQSLLDHFDRVNTHPPQPTAEVLKRAGLIMALTAWETYVEDRIVETIAHQLAGESESIHKAFMLKHLGVALKTFHTPDSAKTCRLFEEYLGIDISLKWRWNHFEPERVRKELDRLVKMRGEAVHRSQATSATSEGHLIKRGELEKAIKFVKQLVASTDAATASRTDNE